MRHSLACAALTAVSALWTPPAAAQIAKPAPDVQATDRRDGPVLTPELVRTTMEMFKPLAAAKSLDGIKISADVSYGPDARNELDFCQTPQKAAAPVLISIPAAALSVATSAPTTRSMPMSACSSRARAAVPRQSGA
jgi:hypothetical protein